MIQNEFTDHRTAADAVLRVRDVATHLDCDQDTVYRLIKEGRLRSVRLGRLIRIPVSALADFLGSEEQR